MKISWLKNKDFSKIPTQLLKKALSIFGIIFLFIFFYICFQIYVPLNPTSHETITFTVQRGWGDDEIANSLQKLGIIRSGYFFKFYVITSLKHSGLKAGEYNLSSKMSIHEIANKIAYGDVVRDRIVIFEGWDIKDIANYMQSRGICDENYFIYLTQKNYSEEFDFLRDKPKKLGLEGYLFPDTYEIAKGATCEDVVNDMLANFDKRFTQAMKDEIKKQKKSIFDIITMASLIEKEVRKIEDKKIVSGILWKRIAIGMPLQLDSTVNYVTGKSDPSVLTKDTKIDSPYNTYKYYGLPKGPISNPGIDSIMAAIYPTQTKYLYWLSDGITHFSETLEQHNIAKAKYLN